MIGIYCIENKINGKKYFGQSIDTKTRLGIHKKNLNMGRHENKRLQEEWNKFGEINFMFFHVLETRKNNSDYLERFFISFFECRNPDKGYNIQSGGKSHSISDEGRENMRQASIGRKSTRNGKLRKFVGVTFKYGAWESSISIHKKQTYLGRYSTEEDAALAYDIISLRERGKCFNFPKELVQSSKMPSQKSIPISMFLGVTKKGNFYITRILVNYKNIFLGKFESEIDAAKAYDKYIIDHNLNRRLNFSYE